jgi:hypothetical protein
MLQLLPYVLIHFGLLILSLQFQQNNGAAVARDIDRAPQRLNVVESEL